MAKVNRSLAACWRSNSLVPIEAAAKTFSRMIGRSLSGRCQPMRLSGSSERCAIGERCVGSGNPMSWSVYIKYVAHLLVSAPEGPTKACERSRDWRSPTLLFTPLFFGSDYNSHRSLWVTWPLSPRTWIEFQDPTSPTPRLEMQIALRHTWKLLLALSPTLFQSITGPIDPEPLTTRYLDKDREKLPVVASL